ncbi:hypothetical protein BHYA_0489g00010 [Botrytis hyacinthi]|uniref:Uncharacterized protein n=1 Tax=Botrytis hyacinthi TaxID=278943 RepID=A0A4Z1GBL7_9HELO|nr:hypothetical protein BHYA_0489g00010 [Botrytis hyacinthi]
MSASSGGGHGAVGEGVKRARSGRSKRPEYARSCPRTGELQKLDDVESTLFPKYTNRHIALVPALILARH